MEQKETPYFEIRANYNAETIVVYQAFSEEIAAPAVKAQTFVAPFSFERMTWIKPSFLWLMERSRWGQSKGQEHTLAVRITREGWEKALRLSALSSPKHLDADAWKEQLRESPVRVQWDPERSLRGQKLLYRSVQVGLGRAVTPLYASEWIKEIQDLSPLVAKLRELRRDGEYEKAERLLPPERPYPTPEDIKQRLGMTR